MDAIEITWLGHASFRMRTPEGRIIYLDPWIDANPACPIGLDQVRTADIVCVTHGHDDHLGDSLEIAKRTGAILVSLPEICIYASRHGIEYDRGGGAIHIGGTTRAHEVEITAVPAAHSSDILGVEFAEEERVMPGSGCCGFVIRTSNSPCVYFSGDTGVFGDMELIGRLYRPHVAVLPIGGKYTMGVREAAFAASLIRPQVVIPSHYNAFPNQQADPEELICRVEVLSPETKVVVLTPGESYLYGRPK